MIALFIRMGLTLNLLKELCKSGDGANAHKNCAERNLHNAIPLWFTSECFVVEDGAWTLTFHETQQCIHLN